ncbi:MAG TPA: hypothetical protein PK122_01065 [Candidatus Paceibacterota bacterium]|nr:hypothetical protein [Candidatus Paceibacterota bacterium]
MSKLIHRSKKLYWALIGTFTALYLAVAFVSTLHAITFFQLANSLGLAILLGAAYEIGQAAVLFSILMTENKNRILAWLMMLLLTALQVTANVYASFKFMDSSGSTDWTYWQRAILFGVQAENQEMYKVIISWISGALLPIVALGMTALVADNIRLAKGEKLGGDDDDDEKLPPERVEEIIENEIQKRIRERELSESKESEEIHSEPPPDEAFELIPDEEIEESPEGILLEDKELDRAFEEEQEYLMDLQDSMIAKEEKIPEVDIKIETVTVDPHPRIYEEKEDGKYYPAPVNKMRGWHLMAEYVDDDHNVFSKGAFVKHDPEKTPTSKKA